MTTLLTFADAIEHGLDKLGGTSDALAERDCKRAVRQAYFDLMNARTWSYLTAHGRVLTVAPYLTGTVAYDHTGGTYEREVLLYGGTFPEWAGPGAELRIGVVTHMVDERKSDTVITLAPAVNPGADVDLARVPLTGVSRTNPIVLTSTAHGLTTGDTAIVEGILPFTEGALISGNGIWVVTVLTANTFSLDGSVGASDGSWDGTSGTWRLPPTTSYTLYKDTYLLPEDFIKSDTAIFEGNFGGLAYSDPTDELWWQRFQFSSGTPRFYTLKGSTLFPGRMVIGLFPFPDRQRTIDYIYERRPRELRLPEYALGTLSTTTGLRLVTGNGTNWSPTMVGCVLRAGTDRVSPTSWVGTSPPEWESVVVEVLSPTSLRTADAVPLLAAQCKYVISDPVDIERGAMEVAFLRGIEKQLAIARNATDKVDAYAAYADALRNAQAADSRSFQGRAMGGLRGRHVPYKYHPADFFPK